MSSHKSSAALQDLIKHNNNPYLNSPSDILGTGTGIASTRDRDRAVLDREKEKKGRETKKEILITRAYRKGLIAWPVTIFPTRI